MKYSVADTSIRRGLSEGAYVEEVVDRILTEGMTQGMKNVIQKALDTRHVCEWCGFPIPKYPGRYPIKCPECRSLLDYRNIGDDNTNGCE